jgi:signal transduction histidine kinase
MDEARRRARTRRPAAPTDHEALTTALFGDADSGLVLVDARGRVRDVNAAATRLLSVTAGRVRGRPAAELLRSVVAGEDPVAEAFGMVRGEREALLLTRSGTELPVLMRSYRFGRPPALLISFRDLTQPRRMREELRRHERLATLGQLSAGVAHEIRNPLAGIGTSAQVLLRRFEPRDDRARFVQVILEEVSRLDRIVNSLLQYARPRVPELKSDALERCIGKVLEVQADALAAAGITVQVVVAPRLGPVYIDADLVTQVLLNLTVNALQAMPDGGTLRFEVRALRRRRAPRGPGRRESDRARGLANVAGWVSYQQVRISDSGTGIPRGLLSKLFDPFFSTRPQGTGLGLSISQTIMQEHGGSIAIASREGRGTTVLLNFPVEKRNGERRQLDARTGNAHAAHR